MIFDTLEHAACYESLHPLFAQAFAFLRKAVEEDLPVGRYELQGSDLYAMVQEYDAKPREQGRFEGHRRYADIQFLLAGTECIDVIESGCGVTTQAYDPEKDLEFFADAEPFHRAVLRAGGFGIFYPHDLHKPGLAYGEPGEKVKKVVVKVRL
jgi:YhcH/YjgK/YiaL family protein